MKRILFSALILIAACGGDDDPKPSWEGKWKYSQADLSVEFRLSKQNSEFLVDNLIVMTASGMHTDATSLVYGNPPSTITISKSAHFLINFESLSLGNNKIHADSLRYTFPSGGIQKVLNVELSRN